VSILPTVTLTKQAQALKTHLMDLACSYIAGTTGTRLSSLHGSSARTPNTIHMVNLIDRRGTQGELGLLLLTVWRRLQRGGVGVKNRFATVTATVDTGRGTGGDGAPALEAAAAEVAAVGDHSTLGGLDRGAVDIQAVDLSFTPVDAKAIYNISEDSGAGTLRASRKLAMNIAARHYWFDYHHKCHAGQRALVELLPLLRGAVSGTEGFFTATRTKSTEAPGAHSNDASRSSTPNLRAYSLQRHLVRTNCMDCLDRTNVAQSVFARWALLGQLAALHRLLAPEGQADTASTEKDELGMELPDKASAEDVNRYLLPSS
jgi:hypothetical protein